MDPLSALAVATAATQFLEFGVNVVSGTWERYRGAASATDNHTDIGSVASTIRDLASNIRQPSHAPLSSNPTINYQQQRQLDKIIKKCQDVADELLALLSELKATGRHKLTESLLITVKAIRKEKKVRQLHQKLVSTQSELALCLVSLVYDNHFEMKLSVDRLWKTTTQEASENLERSKRNDTQQSNMVSALDHLLEKSKSLKLHCSDSLAQLTRQLEGQLRKSQAIQETVHDMHDTIIRLSEEAQVRRSQLRVLESLMDSTLKIRESSICSSHARTYEWMLTPRDANIYQNVQFLEWLRDETGVFWVAGKPGSGKSTLMKFVPSDSRTRTALEQWADEKRLIIGRHFFWMAGYDLQRSQDGLLRSLLYTVLSECPNLMPTVVPEQWGASVNKPMNWTRNELLDSLRRICATPVTDAKFCFFIDALDEYSDNHEELVDIIALLCGTPNIKVCLSSREWPIFDHYFGKNRVSGSLPVRQIRLQLYTREDIRQYVTDRVERNQRYQSLLTIQSSGLVPEQKEALVEEVLERAEGVFLWVSLVCDELLRGFGNLDDIGTLRLRLRNLPTDLELFFQRMIERVEPIYQAQCAQILQVLIEARNPIPLRQLDFLADDPNFGTRVRPAALLPCDNETRMVQLRARCADLIQFGRPIGNTFPQYLGPEVTFMHRTVGDFLVTPHIQTFLATKLPRGFSADAYILNSLATLVRQCKVRIRPGRILDDIVHHARKLEMQSGGADELIDGVLGVLLHVVGLWLDDHYAYLNPGLVRETDCQETRQTGHTKLLTFVLQAGLQLCAERLLDTDPGLFKLASSQHALLYHAIKPLLGSMDLGEMDIDRILKTVRTLVSRGASPNQPVPLPPVSDKYDPDLESRQRTPWTALVERFNLAGEVSSSRCFDTVTALIEAGACEHSFQELTLINTAFLSSYQLNQLARSRRVAKQRGFVPWHLRHFGCYMAYAIAPLQARSAAGSRFLSKAGSGVFQSRAVRDSVFVFGFVFLSYCLVAIWLFFPLIG
ncbi:hypothetical protein QBC47DRAFT_218483 [Echria macrotheca]|uniref:NACHT domain-containing protein n=1 Tax=Echria macrotheca TaxID=438768 RepID=A0AAJ0BAH9_9PEZI|nr:hypothetical protein QBC47DRAFT_218483 [Echria macrotheca]